MSVELREIAELNGLHLGKEPSPFIGRLLKRVVAGKVSAEFRVFLRRAGSNVGRAAWMYKQAKGMWP